MSQIEYAPREVQEEWKDLFLEKVSEASLKVERGKWEHFTPQFLDTASQDFATSEALEIAQARRDIYQAEKISQLEAHVHIETSMPITVFHLGDIHFGSIFTNNELWEYYRHRIIDTPGAYVIFYHNLVDNAIPGKFANNILNNAVPPDIQFKTMQAWIKELDEAGKVLGAIEGDCHEGWSWQLAGVSASNLLYGYEGRRFPVLENGGVLYITIGREKYGIGLWHKQGPFNSNFNPEHSLRQNRRLYHEGETDVEVGAHNHIAAASASWVGSRRVLRPVHWIRVGTFKGVPTFPGHENDFVTDHFPVDRRGISGEPPGASTTFWDKEHWLDSSLEFDVGIEKHLAIRTLALVREMGLEEELKRIMKQQQ